jgi:cell division control protein 24
MDHEEMESGEETDPVTSMWNMLRQGLPLLAIYNATNPPTPLAINRARVKEPNIPKAAAFKFLQACLDDLQIPQDQCFLVTDLYGQDTTGFVKVLRVINRVVDVLQARGLLFQSQDDAQQDTAVEPQQKSHTEMIVSELVTTERNYVQHLETLKIFKDQLEQSGSLPGDTIHDIFLNLNNLLDFQQRFLIRIEQQNALDPSMQNWGQLFVQYQDGFRVYEPFIGNQHHGNETVTKHWSIIEKIPYTPKVQGMVGSVTVLTGFLLKPFQRLSKYPLLLEVCSSNTSLL